MSKEGATSPGGKFEDLARRLLAVPKSELDAARDKAKRESTGKPRRPTP
jgi:hypothetical protein